MAKKAMILKQQKKAKYSTRGKQSLQDMVAGPHA